MTPKRILFLDAYDSFTNNIVSLLHEALDDDDVYVHVIRMDLRTLRSDPTPDWTAEQFYARLSCFDAVVCGPGPGSPSCAEDVGAFTRLWELSRGSHDDTVIPPVLGICLGFQSLVAHFGGRVRRLRRGLHGMVRRIDHRGLRTSAADADAAADIFGGVPPFRATLYHSLCADVGQDDAEEEEGEWLADARWRRVGDLLPLAWLTEPDDDGEGGGERVLMAARHVSLPFWGVQFHPESVCTDVDAVHALLRGWFARATAWNVRCGRVVRSWELPLLRPSSSSHSPGPSSARQIEETGSGAGLVGRGARRCGYVCREIGLPSGVDAADVAEILEGRATVEGGEGEVIVLDSSSAVGGDPLARRSIVALDVGQAPRLEFRVGDGHVTLRCRGEAAQKIPLADDDPMAVYRVMTEYWEARRLSAEDKEEEGAQCDDGFFKGGFMGFVTYEMGLSTLSPGIVPAEAARRGHQRPDLVMAWVANSVVLDHVAGVAYVQCLTTNGEGGSWIDGAVRRLQGSAAWRGGRRLVRCPEASMSHEELWRDVERRRGGGDDEDYGDDGLKIKVPDWEKYEDDVRCCQQAIREGHSYELCLTAQTTMTRRLRRRPARTNDEQRTADDVSEQQDESSSAWEMYRTLRKRQPAPFGSYVRLGGATIASSSPERFLSTSHDGRCTMRPMKGTVRKSSSSSSSSTTMTATTLADAERILRVPKEEAENLMIVDLVRHDLHGVCGPRGVSVPALLRVEEYASVFQMVTVVEGRLGGHDATKTATGEEEGEGEEGGAVNGIHVLAATLPPGSMTGAPKKRSCEILRALEPVERGVYSGVVGYFDAQGRGDWSVTIRTMFRWDDEVTPAAAVGDGGVRDDEEREVWRIGAGGAVTILSTPQGEREEMFTKLFGPLGTFRDVA